jgi:hypothetical protein
VIVRLGSMSGDDERRQTACMKNARSDGRLIVDKYFVTLADGFAEPCIISVL